MSRIRADRIVDRASTGAPLFPNGAVVTGVATATTFDGNATSATSATSAAGLTGTPNITVGSVTGTTGNFSSNVTVQGQLTYEDVTNVDSIGIITAKGGAHFNGGASLREKINIVSGKLSANLDINLDNGMVHYFTTTEDAQSIPNIKSSVGINTELAVGDTASVTIITTAAAAGYGTTIKIDGEDTGALNWVGGTEPSTGGSSGLDIYSYQIIKTANETFTVIGNLTNAASA
jgi:hypothetical protein|tara:strand:- start:741 stop:1439 length:699 start_codon:yes stop_codon:yes gene_type:complete